MCSNREGQGSHPTLQRRDAARCSPVAGGRGAALGRAFVAAVLMLLGTGAVVLTWAAGAPLLQLRSGRAAMAIPPQPGPGHRESME